MSPVKARSPEERDSPDKSNGQNRPAAARIGKYQIETEIDAGHRARIRVFRAVDPDTSRAVKLKLLADVTDKGLAERFRREVATVARLRSPGIVAIYELGEHVGLPFAALQCFGDDHLGLAIKGQRSFTMLEKASIMWQVAEGVRDAHRNGLPYVGIRPSGIALGSDGSAAVQDFGVVRLTGGETTEGALYHAPEEFTAGFVPDSLCDVFAFGVVYYELLTGTHPFLGGSSSEAMIGILHREPFRLRELVPECPDALEQLVARALDKRREFRYASFDQIQEDAEPILQDLKGARNAAAHSRRAAGAQDVEVAQLLAEARRLLDQQQLPEAHAKAVEVLEKDPQNHRAGELLTAITEAIERREREARAEEELEKAKSLLLLRSFDEALAILQALRADSADPWIIDQWIAHVQAQKADDERQNRMEAQANQARSLLDGQQFTEAVALLEAVVAEFPNDGTLQDLLLQAREGSAKAQAIEEALARCDQACRENDFASACQILDNVQAAYPGERLLMERRRSVQDDWENLKLSTAVRQALDEVEWLLEQDRLDLAVKFLRDKTAELADAPGLDSRLAEIEKMMPEWEQRRFIRFIHDYSMSRVAALEQLEQWPVALTVLEEALVSCPASGEMIETAERLRRRLREQEHQKKLARRLEAIHQKIAAEAWQPALALIEAGQREFPDEPQLQAVLERAQAGLRRSECENLTAEVRRRVADGEIADARQLVRKGLESLGPEPSLSSLQQEVEAAAQYQEEWRNAQLLCGRRCFNEAEEILVRLAAPQRPEVQALLAMVREARATSDEKQFILRCREKAQQLIEQQAFDEASDLLAKLRVLYPEDAGAEKPAETAPARDPLSERPARDSSFEAAPIAEGERADATMFATAVKLARLAGVATKLVLVAALLLGAGATVWKLSRPRVPTQAAAQIQQTRAAQAPVATPQAPTVTAEVEPRTVILPPETDTKPRAAGRAERAEEAQRVAHRAFDTSALSPASNKPPVTLPAAPVALEPAAPGVVSGVQALISDVAPRRLESDSAPEKRAADSALASDANFQAPKVLTAPAPRFPELAKQQHLSGDVTLEAMITKQGTVSNVVATRGNPLLSRAAIDAVRSWRYQPATLRGQAIEAKIEITVVFRANQK